MSKVLFIINSLHGGGAEKVLKDILTNIDYSRFEVTLLLRIREGVYLNQIPDNVRIISVYETDSKPTLFVKIQRKIPFLFQRMMKREITKIIEEEKFDTIVSFLEGLPVVYHSFIKKHADRHISWVHTDLNDTTRDFYFRNRTHEHRCYSGMDTIVCVSPTAKNIFDNLYGDKSNRSIVITNIIDKEYIRERSKAFNPKFSGFNIICIGRLMPVKRYDRVIEMASILKSRGLQFHINLIGEGEQRASLEARIDKLGLKNEISLLGFKNNVYPYLVSSDLMIVSSDIEGYPLVVAEALVLGVPVVSTRITGPCDMLSEGGGVLTDLSPEALADAVERLMKDPEYYKRLSQEAATIGENFSKEKIMEQINLLLDGTDTETKKS